MKKESWKRLIYQGIDYGDYYEVSNCGEIRNSKTKKIRKKNLLKTGYYFVNGSLGNRKNKITFRVHKAVAETFIENKENKPIINHKDGNKLNNAVDNLEWCTYSENTQHALDNNLINNVPNKKRIKCIELNKCFNTITECAKYMFDNNYTNSKSAKNVRILISRILNGKRKTVNGYTFKYI